MSSSGRPWRPPKMSGFILDWIINKERRQTITKIVDQANWEMFTSALDAEVVRH